MAQVPWLKVDETWRGPLRRDQIGPTFEVLCPVCGFDYNHVGPPVRADAGGPVEEGIHPYGDDRRLGVSCKGGGWAVPMSCENGHEWGLFLGFHKGNSYLFAAAPPTRALEHESK